MADASKVFKPWSSQWDDNLEAVYGREYNDEEEFKSDRNYKAQMQAYMSMLKSTLDVNDWGVNLSHASRRRSDLSKTELDDLYWMAINSYPSESFKTIRWLYRDKPSDFFKDAMANGGVMKSYTKDSSGDPRSPINGKLDGLFFASNMDRNGELPSVSYFGDTRLKVPAAFFFSPESRYKCPSEGSKAVRLYFADFYCMRGSMHWVTLVLTYAGTLADRFCEMRLLELDLRTNHLLRVSKDGAVTMRDSDLAMEFFYTSDVDLNYWQDWGAIITPVKPVGKGSSTVGGLSKNPECDKCWLPPPFYDY